VLILLKVVLNIKSNHLSAILCFLLCFIDVPVLEQTDKDVLVTLEADIAVVKKTEEFKISKKVKISYNQISCMLF
jgi:hypothetical protein